MNGLAYFKPTGLVRSSAAVAPGFGGGGGSAYPSIANAALWFDRNRNVFSDIAGTNPASINGTIGSWRSVGGVWGTDLVTQATGSQQPILKSDGIATDGIDDRLACSIALSGDFTLYFVASRTATNQNICFAAYPAEFGFFVSNNNSTIYGATTDSGWLPLTGFTGLTSTFITRYRVNGTNFYIKASGHAEQTQAGVTVPAVTLTKILRATIETSNSNARFKQMVLVNRSLAYGGADDLAIRAALVTLEPGVLDL